MPENIFMPTYDIISYLWGKRDIHSCAVGGIVCVGEGKGRIAGAIRLCDRQQLWLDAEA